MRRIALLLFVAALAAYPQAVQVSENPHSVNTIFNGNGLPSNALGNTGDFYINTANWTMYGPKNGTWPTSGFLLGGNATTSGGNATGLATATINSSGHLILTLNNGAQVDAGAVTGAITWPASGDLVISNGTNAPLGLPPINGDCALGSGGAWLTGSCGSGGGGGAAVWGTITGTLSSQTDLAAALAAKQNTLTFTGPGAKTASSTGATISGDCAKWDASGNVVDAGAACGSGSGGGSGLYVYAGNAPFSLVCDGATDNTAGMTAIQAFQQNNPGATIVFPPGVCLYQGYQWTWGATSATWIGSGQGSNRTTLRNSQSGGLNLAVGGDDFTCQAWVGNANPTGFSGYRSYTSGVIAINTVTAKSTTVTVQTPGSLTGWQVGDPVLIYGYDQQGGGYPPNYRHFDRAKIIAINTGTGVVTLDTPLTQSYNQNWPYSASANTTPPSIKNLRAAVGCTGGGGGYTGSFGQMEYFHAIGIDFSTLPASQVGYVDGQVIVNDVAYAQFDDCKFGSVYPSQTGIMQVNGGSINTSEPDKLVNQYKLKGVTLNGGQAPSTTGVAMAEGTGVNYIEFDNVTVTGGVINLSPRRFVNKNSTFHAITTFGFLGTALGGVDWYNPSYVAENPVFYADGLTPGGLFGGNAYTAVTVGSATSGSFLSPSGSALLVTQLLGPGSVIRGSNSTLPSAILGTVTDVIQSGSTVQVLGTWGMSITTGQTIYLDPNPVSATLINPTAADFDINQVGVSWNPFGPSVTSVFEVPTTVADLGTCSYPTTGAGVGGIVTKWVKDSLTSTFTGTGGGGYYAQVKCDPTTFTWVGIQGAQSAGPFSGLSSGTNTTAAMQVGTGASIAPTGSGVVNANQVAGVAISGTAANGLPLLATGSAAAAWGGVAQVPVAGMDTLSGGPTVAFTTAQGSTTVILTSNVTSWTIPSGVFNGQHKTLVWCQAGGGGYSVAGTPSNVIGFVTPGTTGTACSSQMFVWNTSQTPNAWRAAGWAVTNDTPNNLSFSGNTTVAASTTGTHTSGDCAKWDANGNVIDAGAACGSGGGSLPSQTGNAGLWLTTNGTAASWSDLTTGPSGALCAGTGCSGGTAGQIDINTAVVPRVAAANTFTGVQTFTQAIVGVSGSSETVSFSATPTFSNTLGTSLITMTANITGFTLGAGINGQEKTLTFCQDTTGGRTVGGVPSNVRGFMTIPGAQSANLCNSQHFKYYTSLSAWLADSAGVTGQ